jgi:hypothetical protein
VAVDSKGRIMNNKDGEPEVIICNFEVIWKTADSGSSPRRTVSCDSGKNTVQEVNQKR